MHQQMHPSLNLTKF